MTTSIKKYKFGEIVYLLLFGFVIVNQALANVAINIGPVQYVLDSLIFVLKIFVFIKILVDWNKYWNYKEIFIALITVGFLAICNFNWPHENVSSYVILILGAKNIDYKRILKLYFCIIFSFLIVIISATSLGFIANYVYTRNVGVTYTRNSLGFFYPTDVCAYFFFASMALFFVRGKNISYVEIFAITILSIILFYFTQGINTLVCTILAVCFLIFSKIRKNNNNNSRLLNVFLVLYMPVLCLVTIFLGLFYSENNSILYSVNTLLGGKLSTINAAFTKYGLSILGRPMVNNSYEKMLLLGKTSFRPYIDCLYVSILIKAGILALLAIVIACVLLIYRECRMKSYIRAILLCIIVTHSIIEHNALNPFLLLLFTGNTTSYYDEKTYLYRAAKKVFRKEISDVLIKNILSLLVFAFFVEILTFNMQSITSMFNSNILSTEFDSKIYQVEKNDDGTLHAQDGFYIIANNVDRDIENVWFCLNLYDYNSKKYLPNEMYYVDILAFNSEINDYELIKRADIISGKYSSGFVDLGERYKSDSYIFVFEVSDSYSFDISNITINASKPFNINMLRILIIFSVLASIYYFGIEKKNSDVSENTKEIQKVTADFKSTGALRTKEHENMREVYSKKSAFYIGTKRLMDIVLSGFAIVVLSPLFLATAIAIKLEDKGPAFFVQYRAGKNLKPFKIWKFRSMYVDADKKLKELMTDNEQTGHAFKMKDDPRITKVGKFIRKYSIDELPQLFNVFLGDMSIVGPRPILVFQMEECDDYDKQRLIVQPGLTCIWQVSGRANIKWDKWIELDLEYIDKMSLWMDIKLILKTIPVVITGDGAF